MGKSIIEIQQDAQKLKQIIEQELRTFIESTGCVPLVEITTREHQTDCGSRSTIVCDIMIPVA